MGTAIVDPQRVPRIESQEALIRSPLSPLPQQLVPPNPHAFPPLFIWTIAGTTAVTVPSTDPAPVSVRPAVILH
jgi:hypothetical protein